MLMKRNKGYLFLSVVSCLVTMLVSIFWAFPGQTHLNDLSVAKILIGTRDTQITLTLPNNFLTVIDKNQDHKISPLEVENHDLELKQFLGDRLSLVNSQGVKANLTILPSQEVILPSNVSLAADTHNTLILKYSWVEPIEQLKINYNLFPDSSPNAHCLATIYHNGKMQSMIFNRSNKNFTLNLNDSLGLTSKNWLAAIAIAFVWGAAHALSPGHGKTMIGAYLIGAKATPSHAIFLGLTTTITHTIGVFALGIVVLFASQYILPEQLYPWLGLISGVMIVIIGINLCWQRMDGGNHHHHHDHSHHHHHPDNLFTNWRSLLALGISGGIVPCPAALVLLLSMISLNQVGLGLTLIFVFSLGLAITLSGLGLLLVKAKSLFKKLPTKSSLGRFLPIASSIVIILIGLGVTTQALYKVRIVFDSGFGYL